jgi:hypothetical protein
MTPSPLPENRVRALNDAFRIDSPAAGGRWVLARGVQAPGPELVLCAVRKVMTFDKFDEDNDPWAEHDFGSISLSGETLFWKIDYHDLALEAGSEAPANPEVAARILTLMLAEEY